MDSLAPLISREFGVNLIQTREPGGTPQADLIRALFAKDSKDDPWLPLTEAFLVGAARSQHVHVKIQPALNKGIWVLCDRFADSTRVYQRLVPEATLESLIHNATNGLEPDLTFILDCPVEIAMSRTKSRGSTGNTAAKTIGPTPALTTDSIDRYDHESLELHHQRRQAYLNLAQRFPHRIVVIDGSQSPPEVLAQAFAVFTTRFGNPIS